MDSATNPAKRTRFNATAQATTLTASATELKSPLALADQQISRHVESLLPKIATIIKTSALSHIRLLVKIHHKRKQVSKMVTDEEFFPRSARLKFSLTVSKEVEESPEFLALQQENESRVLVYKNGLKADVISAIKLEITATETSLKTDLAKSLCLISRAFLIADSHTDLDPHRLVNTLLDRYHEPLLKNASTTLAEFRRVYVEAHGLASLPNPVLVPHHHMLTQPGTPPPAQQSNADQEIDKLHRALDATFLCPWEIYQDTSKRLAIDLELQKLSTSYFTEEATENAQMEVDNEAPADRQQLQELVRKQAQAENKKLVKELNLLKQQLSSLNLEAKNSPRGRSGASNKKENARSPSRQRHSTRQTSPRSRTSRQPRANKSQKAGAAAKDSTAENQTSAKKNKGTQSRKKNTQSTNRNSTQSSRSRKGSK
jgi:hypothetical protein